MNNRRQRPKAKAEPLSASSSQLSQMFVWSDNPVKVREFVDQRVLPVPTIARIDVKPNSQSDKSNTMDFQSGSIYLIYSMFSQLLVVARNKEKRYWTIPLTSSLKFHLLGESSEFKTCQSAVDPLTLADMLSDADITSFEGTRVRLASSSTPMGNLVQGELELVSTYNEKYLLGYAFSGATVTDNVKVLPGYIPLTVQTASCMNTSSSTRSYQQYVHQLLSATESFTQNFNIAGLLEEITMHDENPQSDYASIDEFYKRQLQTQSNRYIKLKSLPKRMIQPSNATVSSLPKEMTPTNNATASSTLTSNKHTHKSPTTAGGVRRPLPPVPAMMNHTPATTTWSHNSGLTHRTRLSEDQQFSKSRPRSHEVFDETLIGTFQTRRKAVTGVTVSLPVILRRVSSDSTLLDEKGGGDSIEHSAPLSSLSLENLSQTDERFSLSSDTKSASKVESTSATPLQNQSDGGADRKQSNDEEETHGQFPTILRRQRPVARSRKIEVYKRPVEPTKLAMTLPRNYRLSTGRSSTGAELYENVYETIKSPNQPAVSPIYWDMSASSSLTFPRRLPTDSRLPSTLENWYQRPAYPPVTRHSMATIMTSTDSYLPSTLENWYQRPAYPPVTKHSMATIMTSTDGYLPSTLHNSYIYTCSPLRKNSMAINGRPSTISDENSIYEEFRPKISMPSTNEETTYVNLNFAVASDVVPPATAVVKPENRSGIVKPRVRITKSEVCIVDGGQRPQNRTNVVQGVASTRIREHDTISGEQTPCPEDTVDGDEQRRFGGSDTSESFNDSLNDRSQVSFHPSGVLPDVNPVEHFAVNVPQLDSDDVEHPSWSNLNDVPSDIASLTVRGVAACLELLHLNKYVTRFGEEQIDGDLLTSLDKDVLMEDFGFNRFEAIKLEKFARHGWRPRLKIGSPPTIQISSESFC